MRWRRVIFRAVAVTLAAFLIVVGAIAVQAVIAFDGKCGGFMPFLAAARPCTLWEYVQYSLSLTFAVLFQEILLIGLSVAAVVLAGSAIFERFRSRRNAL
jgi:hypothetical protein